MQIDTSALATLKAFNQFATSAVKDSDIARIDSSRPQGASLNITKATGDRAWWALTRSTASKIDNNAVRFAFQNAINSLFGGEENIPQSVKDVMKLDDYGKGRPLTARRITAVTTAISQALKDAGPLSDQGGFSIRTEDVMRGIGTAKELSPKEANKELRESFASTEPISKSGMPMAFANELRGILNEAYTRFRGAPPANEPCARDFVGGSLSTEINALIDKANKEGRRFTLEEFSAAARPLYMRHAAASVLKETVDALVKEMGMESVHVGLIKNTHPEIIDDLAACNTPEEVRSHVESHKETIKNALLMLNDLRTYDDKFISMVEDAINAGQGKGDVQFKFGRTTEGLRGKFLFFKDSVLSGKNADMKKPGWNVHDAVKQQVNKVAGDFIARFNEIANCVASGEISADLAKMWKEDIVQSCNAKDFFPEKVVAGAKKLDPKVLIDGFKPENDTRTALMALGEFAKQIETVGQEMYGGGHAWKDAGPDARNVVKERIMDVLFEKTPGLKEAVFSRLEEMSNNFASILTRHEANNVGGKRTIQGPDYDLANILFGNNGSLFNYLHADGAKV